MRASSTVKRQFTRVADRLRSVAHAFTSRRSVSMSAKRRPRHCASPKRRVLAPPCSATSLAKLPAGRRTLLSSLKAGPPLARRFRRFRRFRRRRRPCEWRGCRKPAGCTRPPGRDPLRGGVHLFSELPAPPTLGHGRPAPTRQRLEGHQYVGHATPLVLVVAALGAPRFARQRLAHLGEHLAGTLVEAHHRTLLVVGFFVEVNYLFPMRQTNCAWSSWAGSPTL